MFSSTQRTGFIGERIAERYLVAKGWRIIERNVQASGGPGGRQRGELDLVCEDRGVRVFVEVKLRHNPDYGDPAEAVTPEKLTRTRAAIVYYLNQHPTRVWRLDVLAIIMLSDRARVTHYRDVLQV